jgi:integrase
MAEKLTDALARNHPTPTDGKLYAIVYDTDVKGFGLRITKAGARAFVLNYRAKGIERRYTIGAHPDWKVNAAREEAKRLKREIDRGRDPMEERHEEWAAPTVAELCDRYLAEYASRKRDGSRLEDEGLIRQWVKPEFGNRKATDVEHGDIDALHRKITKAGTPYRANRVAALLSKMFNLAIKWKVRADNPVKGLDKNQEVKRQRYLSPEELRRLSVALAEHKNHEGSNAIRLLLLTGARRGEVLKATWDQFDLKAGVWTKPGAMTKQNTEHRVPLSVPALQLLVEMRAEADHGDMTAANLEREAAHETHPKKAAARRNAAARWRERKTTPYLFPGGIPGTPVMNITKFWAGICSDAGLTGVRIHDLRHNSGSRIIPSAVAIAAYFRTIIKVSISASR